MTVYHFLTDKENSKFPAAAGKQQAFGRFSSRPNYIKRTYKREVISSKHNSIPSTSPGFFEPKGRLVHLIHYGLKSVDHVWKLKFLLLSARLSGFLKGYQRTSAFSLPFTHFCRFCFATACLYTLQIGFDSFFSKASILTRTNVLYSHKATDSDWLQIWETF